MNFPRYRLVAVAVAVSAWLSVPCHAETLADVIAYADETNPGLQAQRAALRALDESYVQARGSFGLTISATGGETSYEIRRSGAKADAVTDNIGLSISQPLYTGGRLSARLSQAEAQIRAGREQLRRAQLDLLLRVVGGYESVRRDEKLEEIAKDNVQALERALHDTQAKFNVHTVTMTDLVQARARLAQAQTQLFSIQEQLAASRSQFFASVGRNPGTLEAPAPLETLPRSLEAAFDAAEANSPQLLSAAYTEQSSRARVAQARAAGRPTVTARVDLQRTPTQPYQPMPYDDSRSASVIVNQPLFTSGQISSGIRQAIEENNRDRLIIDDTRLQVIQNVAQAWERVVSLRKQLVSLDEEVRANELAFYGVHAEERLALRSNIEVLNAEAELSAAQQNLTRARAAEYVARVQLLASVGVLTPSMLSTSVTPYDPAKNFQRVKDKGASPLEWPVRGLDAIGAPRIGPARPSSISETTPGGSEAEPTPRPQRPITSILDVLDRPPPASPPP